MNCRSPTELVNLVLSVSCSQLRLYFRCLESPLTEKKESLLSANLFFSLLQLFIGQEVKSSLLNRVIFIPCSWNEIGLSTCEIELKKQSTTSLNVR